MQFHPANASIEPLILSTFEGKICQHSPISLMVKEHPIELHTPWRWFPRATIIPSLRRSCDAQNGIAKILLFSFMQHYFDFFIFRFLLIVRKIIFQTTRFQPFFRPFSGVFPGNRPLFGSPFRSFSQKTWDFSKEIDTLSPPLWHLSLSKAPRQRRKIRKNTSGDATEEKMERIHSKQKHNKNTTIFYIHFHKKKFTPIL